MKVFTASSSSCPSNANNSPYDMATDPRSLPIGKTFFTTSLVDAIEGSTCRGSASSTRRHFAENNEQDFRYKSIEMFYPFTDVALLVT
jgi:hypothetical protein